MSHVIFSGAVQLLGWSDTHNAGPKLVLQLESSEDLEAFKHLTVKHGKTAGQLLGIAVTLINPATGLEPGVELEHPLATKPKGGALSRLAGMWCGNTAFREWLQQKWPGHWGDAYLTVEEPAASDIAKLVLYGLCTIQSLAELDHNEMAADFFKREIREPFMRSQGQALDRP